MLVKAEVRLSGMKSIDEVLNLGDGISVKTVSDAVVELSTTNSAYNQLLSDADKMLIKLRGLEHNMGDLMDRTLAKAAGKYGRDSTEYAQMGGTRKSERKKPGRAKKVKQQQIQHKQQKALQKAQQQQQQAANGHAEAPNGAVNGQAAHASGVAPAGATPA
jgi:hypothetical protein